MSTPDNDQHTTKPRKRGIYLLPNLFTTAGLFAGFYAITAASNGKFEAAAIAIFVAMLMDGIDGRVARMTNTQSAFGAEYDSMADMVSFGVAPALVMFHWSLFSMEKIGWLAAFVYTAGAALRLARFNTQVGIADKRYFQGLPSPAAAALLAGLVWLGVDFDLSGQDMRIPVFMLTFLAGVLMVSNVRYHSFKDIDLKGKVPFVTLVAVSMIFAVTYLHPPVILFSGFLIYALIGPVMTLVNLRKKKGRHTSDTTEKDIHSQ